MIGSAGLSGFLGAGQAAHLQPVLRINQRVLVRDFGQAERLHANAEARRIHHHEHRVQTFVRFTDQPADGAIDIHLAGGVAVNAHFLFDRTAENRIALAQRTVGFRQEFRHDE